MQKRYTVFGLLAAVILVFSPVVSSAQGVRPLTLQRVSIAVGPGSGSAIFLPRITAMNRPAKVGIQFAFAYVSPSGKPMTEVVSAETEDGPVVLDLVPGKETLVKLQIPLPPGTYKSYKMVLYNSPDGKAVDFNKPVYDMSTDPTKGMQPINMTIRGARKLLLPIIKKIEDPVITPGVNGYSVSISADIILPENYSNDKNGFMTIAKNGNGISRQFVSLSNAVEAEDVLSPYKHIPVKFNYSSVKPGVWSVEFAIARPNSMTEFRSGEGRLEFEVGGDAWRRMASDLVKPKRVQVKNRRFVTLEGEPVDLYKDMPSATDGLAAIRGGNYGNSICWTIAPAQNRPEYFMQLKKFGLRFIRTNFQADRYLSEELYRSVLDQFVQNAWMAGLYPIISPQEFPMHKSGPMRSELNVKLLKMLAEKYKGQPVWYHILNEPFIFQTWEKWKPVAIRYVKAIRSIDPDAFVIVPFEGWATDGRGAATNPIREVRVDLYDAHAYINPREFAERYGPAVRAGLPVMIGEYGGDTASYLSQMDSEIQKLPGILAIAPWAFTVPGMDFLALVENSTEDGLTFTQTGKAIQTDFQLWNLGKRKP